MVQVTKTALEGVRLITTKRFEDERGFFSETFSVDLFASEGIEFGCVQDNHVLTRAAYTLRGIHYQLAPFSQAKLVRVLKGSVFDVAVDLRRGSSTYGKWCGATLTAAGGEQLFVPRGFAHAYCTLEPDTDVSYKVDDYYAPANEGGIRWSDPALGIAWPIEARLVVLSDRDRALPLLADFETPFV